MNTAQAFKMAWQAIRTNKMRSILTMLGIVIGVAAVISLVSIGQGVTQSVTSQVNDLGTNLISVSIQGRGVKTSLTLDEAMAYGEKKGVSAVAPVVSGMVKVRYANVTDTISLEGITPDYETVRNFSVASGRFLLPIDIDYGQKVALIGAETAANLFGEKSPIGEMMQVNGTPFRVVGVLEEKGSGMTGSNDDKILIPIRTAERLVKNKGVQMFYVQAETSDTVDQVVSQLEKDLSSKFPKQEDDEYEPYQIFNQKEMLSAVGTITSTLTTALAGIAGISLLVGGIGIMNIMLVSVSERTREIGIRKAIGAKRRDILIQFLIESILLGGIGGIIGLVLGGSGAVSLGKLMGIDVSVSLGTAGFAFIFSVAVGVSFGLFPANKAAKLKPIEALRMD
ncbi:ABC transporter permease [Paenibacillus sp. YN15]|uniref:ABC transporter permease n=1 Tax=Paenibacillus sp. YN15 TaxID=1742774 RepID=UPI000DCAE91A|nr:ABC transporter permease [Paenibacillus sp. YN15]RAV05026.1 ABC transporter permease [Paenibacillus sp. YN15]